MRCRGKIAVRAAAELEGPEADAIDSLRLTNSENEKEEEVRVDMNFDNVIFCDNLPVVPQEKYEKLVTVLTKIFGQIGQIQDGEQRPVDRSGRS